MRGSGKGGVRRRLYNIVHISARAKTHINSDDRYCELPNGLISGRFKLLRGQNRRPPRLRRAPFLVPHVVVGYLRGRDLLYKNCRADDHMAAIRGALTTIRGRSRILSEWLRIIRELSLGRVGKVARG